MLPPAFMEYKGLKLREFDLDGALKRKPQLLLVDELAHTNCGAAEMKSGIRM